MSHNDTIVAQATPPGRGGVGILRISGLKARDVARLKAGDTQDAHTPASRRGCLGDDSVVMAHGDSLCRCKKGGPLTAFSGINATVDTRNNSSCRKAAS